MAAFYDNLTHAEIKTLDGLSRLMMELRDSRRQLLERYGTESESALLERIHAGELAEHPAYDDYLGAHIIAATHDQIRAELKNYMLEINSQ